jgi:VanZ family protein
MTCLALCLALVLAATLSPTPLDQGYRGAVDKLLGVLHRHGVPEWFGYGKLEFSANIAMFIPIGFLVALILPARVWWISLIICPALSISIELTQGALLSARFASGADVAANSIGGVVGILVAILLRAAVYERDEKIIARALWERNSSSNS